LAKKFLGKTSFYRSSTFSIPGAEGGGASSRVVSSGHV
jgi:hypothetical protein